MASLVSMFYPNTLVARRLAGLCGIAIIGLCTALQNLPEAHAEQRPEQMQRVQELMKIGRYDEAQELAKAYIKNHPDDPKMHFTLGLIFTNQAKWQQAIDVFREMTHEFPDLPAPYNNLAVVYAEVGHYDKAVEVLKEALEIDPVYAAAHENLGDIYVTLAALSYREAMASDGGKQTAQAKLTVLTNLVPELPATHQSPAPTSPPDPRRHDAGGDATSAEIERIVTDWAGAWSAQNVDRYLSYYADKFMPPLGKSVGVWRAERRRRLVAPSYIRVAVRHLQIFVFTPNRAKATFLQEYQSDYYTDSTRKLLKLERLGGEWKIVREVTVEEPRHGSQRP